MTENAAGLASRIREAFDHSFASPSVPTTKNLRDFVCITVGADDYAVALEEVAAIVPVTKIVKLPSRSESLLGVMGLHGEAICIYSIGQLLGQKAQQASRWLILASSDKSAAFVFEQLGAYLRVPEADLSDLEGPSRSNHVQSVVSVNGQRRPVISVSALLESTGGQPGQRSKEPC